MSEDELKKTMEKANNLIVDALKKKPRLASDCKSENLDNINTGSSSSSSSSSNSDQLKVTHGALAIIGWGVLLPIGAIIARYCRQWEPLWFHLHLFFQLMGYTTGVFTVLAGMSLYYQIHSNVKAHRGLGIFLLVLGTLQETSMKVWQIFIANCMFDATLIYKMAYQDLPNV